MLLLFNVNLHKVCFNWISNTSLITYFCSGLLARFTSLSCNSHSFWDLWYACCFSSHLPTSPSSHSCAVKTKLLTCSSLTPPLPFFYFYFPSPCFSIFVSSWIFPTLSSRFFPGSETADGIERRCPLAADQKQPTIWPLNFTLHTFDKIETLERSKLLIKVPR